MNKYGNRRTAGFASKREHRRAQELQLLEKIGEIQKLEYQIKYELTPLMGTDRASFYIADFRYWERGHQIVEDCKGMRTPLYILKRKVLRMRYGIVIRET